MEGKKRYIAIILFLLICLMVFTFATTGDEELEKGTGNGSNIQDVTDNDSTDSEEKDTESKTDEEELMLKVHPEYKNIYDELEVYKATRPELFRK